MQLIPTATDAIFYRFTPGNMIAFFAYTVRKMNLILRSLERRPQMQFSMARKFKLRQLRRYGVKPSKMSKYAPHLA
jgi:hypothetical protein